MNVDQVLEREMGYGFGIRSQAEVARLMTARGFPMGRSRVWEIEQRALEKLRCDPVLRQLAVDAGVSV